MSTEKPFNRTEYIRGYQRQWLLARRTEWLTLNGPCVECGSDDDLEVDHIDPTQKVTHRVWSWAAERRAAELAKCQVLCRICHGKKTVAQFSKPVSHGTQHGYRRGCRCVLCKEANTAACRNKRRAVVEKRSRCFAEWRRMRQVKQDASR